MSSAGLNFYQGTDVKASLTPGGATLRVEIAGDRCVMDAVVRRAFPLSNPDGYFSIQTRSGVELGLLRSLDDLDPTSRHAIETSLSRRYFTPQILQINSLRQEGGLWTFDVRTTRGTTQFFVRNWRDSSHEIAPGRFLIHSVDGQRFEVPSLDSLDTRSQVLIEQVF